MDIDAGKNKVAYGLFWKFMERMGAQVVTFALSIILARLLEPNDYGIIALILAFIAIADVFAEGGFGNALIQKKDADNTDFSTVFYFNIVFSSVIYLILFLLAPIIASFFQNSLLKDTIRVLGLRVPIAAVNSVQKAFVSRNMLFKRFFYSTLGGTLFSAIIGIVLAYSGFGVWALVIQYLSNTIIDTIVLWFTVKWRPDKIFSLERLEKLFSFGWKLLCSGLIETIYQQLRNLIIGKIYTKQDLAFYNRGNQYPSLVVNNINTSISSVLFPVIAQSQEDKKRVRDITRRSIMISSYIMCPIMMGLALIAKPLIEIMLTSKWLDCVPFLQISCFTYAFYPIHTSNLEAIKAVGRSDLFLKLEIVKKIIGVLVLIFIMKHGVMAIALSGIGITIVTSIINAYPNKKLLGYSYIEQIKDVLPGIFLSIIMGIPVFFLGTIQLDNIMKIFIQIVVGGIIYIVLSIIFKNESFKYINRMLSEMRKR